MKNQGKRLSILSLPEAKELYSVPQFSPHEQEYFFTLTDDELAVVNRINSYRNRIHLILMMGYFRVKRVCLVYGWKDIDEDYRYVAERYYPKANKQNKNLDRQTRSRLYNTVFNIVDYQRYDKSVELDVLAHLENRAMLYIDETQLFKDMVDLLKSDHIAIPRYSTLQLVISKAIKTEENRLSGKVTQFISKPGDFLQLIDSNEKHYRLKDLKKLTKTYKAGEVRKELERYKILSELSSDALNLMSKLKLSDGNIRYFATRCQQYDINRLRELDKGKTLIYLACFIATRFRIANDSLTQSFLIAYKGFDDRSIEYRDNLVKKKALELLADIENIPLVLDLFVDEEIDDSALFGSVRGRAFDIIPQSQLPLVSKKLAKTKSDKAIFQWEFVNNHFGEIVCNIRPLLMALDLGCRDNAVLQKQIDSVKSALTSSSPLPHVDGRLVKKSDKKYLGQTASDAQEQKDKIANRNEMYLYKLLFNGLSNGDVYVENSLEFRSFDDYLVSDRIWDERDKHLSEAGLDWMSQRAEDYLVTLKKMFNEKIEAVSQRIEEGNNPYIKRKPNAEKLLWSKAVTPKDEVLTERFFAHSDRQTIVRVLRKVNEETGFLDHLRPETNRHKKLTASVENLLACIIANGTFQGTHKFSDISDQQYKVLKRIEDDCLHDEALQKANDSITGAAVRLSIFEDFNLDDGQTHSSADGRS